MRHRVAGNELSALLAALNALSAVASRQPNNGELSVVRTAESWVDRITKERWTGKNGLAIASAVVGVGAILYGARKFLVHDKSEGPMR
jgi:hypothetical protein